MKKNRFLSLFLCYIISISLYAGDSIRSDSATVAHFRALGVDFSHNNSVTLLTHGEDKFNDLFEAIRQAKHSIHLEYFNFRNDSIGNLLFDLLKEKANEGVEVRALFDDFGNRSNNKPLKKDKLQELREQGVQIYTFDPIVFPWINHAYHRDHRKIVVIDGVIGYTGGMNVADYYITGRPEFGEWRDMHARFEGDAVGELQSIFLDQWRRTTDEELSGEAYFPNRDSVVVNFQGLAPDTTATAGQKMVAIVDRVPVEQPKLLRQAYKGAIDNAQHKIQIVNPYPTLTRTIRRALNRALKRGVEVEIMVSSKADVPITPDVVAFKMNKLRKRGAEIYFYNGGFHHSKIMMVDSTYCTVGSTNLNARSLAYDYETNAFIIDPHTTAQLTSIFEKDKESCTFLTEEEWKSRSRCKRFRGWVWQLAAPFM